MGVFVSNKFPGNDVKLLFVQLGDGPMLAVSWGLGQAPDLAAP